MENTVLTLKVISGKLQNGKKDNVAGIEAELLLNLGRKSMSLDESVEYKTGKRENLSFQVKFSEKDGKSKEEKTATGSLNVQLPAYPGTFVFGIPATGTEDFPKVTQFLTVEINKPFVDGLNFELPTDRLPDMKTMQLALEMVNSLTALPEKEAERKPIVEKVENLAGAAEAQRQAMVGMTKTIASRKDEIEKRAAEIEAKLNLLKEEEAKLPVLKDQQSELTRLNREIGKVQKDLSKKAVELARIEQAGAIINKLSKKLGFKESPSPEELAKEIEAVKAEVKKANYNRYKQVQEALEEYLGNLKEEIGVIGKSLEAARQALELKNDQANKDKVVELEEALKAKNEEIKTNEATLESARKKIAEVESSPIGRRKKDLDTLQEALGNAEEGPGDELRIKKETLKGFLAQRNALIQALQEGQLKLESYAFERIMLLDHAKEDARQLKQLEKNGQRLENETESWKELVSNLKSAYERIFETKLKEIPKPKLDAQAGAGPNQYLGKASFWKLKPEEAASMAASLSPGEDQLPDLLTFADAVAMGLFLLSIQPEEKDFLRSAATFELEVEKFAGSENFAHVLQQVLPTLVINQDPKKEKEIQVLLKKAKKSFDKPAAPKFNSTSAETTVILADKYRELPSMVLDLLQVRMSALKVPAKTATTLKKLLPSNVLHAILNGNPGQKGAAAKEVLRAAPAKASERSSKFLLNLLREGLGNLNKEVAGKLKEVQRSYPEWNFSARRLDLGILEGTRASTIYAFSGPDAGKGMQALNGLMVLHLGNNWPQLLGANFVLDTDADLLSNLSFKGEISDEIKKAFEKHQAASLEEAIRRLSATGAELKSTGLVLPQGKATAGNAARYADALGQRDDLYARWTLSGSTEDLEEFLAASRKVLALGGDAYLTSGGRRVVMEAIPQMEKVLSRSKIGWTEIKQVWEKVPAIDLSDNAAYLIENLAAGWVENPKEASLGLVQEKIGYWEQILRSALISARPIDLEQFKAGKSKTAAELYNLVSAIAATPMQGEEVLAAAYPKSKSRAAAFVKDLQAVGLKLLAEISQQQ